MLRAPGPATLDAALADACRLLTRGVGDRRSPFHTPTLATVTAAGLPTLRTVVLRSFDAEARQLRVHTDRRSAKYAELQAAPQAALHGYDAAAQVQIRLGGRVSRHADDPLADAAWAGSHPGSRLCYAVTPGPGTPAAAPPTAPQALDAAARGNFAALVLQFDTLEWLWLAAAGHRRAHFAWNAAGDCAASWLVP
jgi:hypothetical protein